MASPQAENGHIDIANEIVEQLAKHRLSGEEWQCVLVVWRKTYGWRKKEDEISLSTFEDMTGMKRPNVVRTLKKLVAKKILGSSNNDTRFAKKYWFNKDFEQWEPVIKKDTTSINNDTPLVAKLITRPVAKKLPSKDNSSKDTITKEKNLSPESLRLSGLLAELILKNNPENIQLRGNKRQSTVNRWAMDIDKLMRLDGRSVDDVEHTIRWCQADSFWSANILSGKTFREKWDKLRVKMKNREPPIKSSKTDYEALIREHEAEEARNGLPVHG